MTDILDDDDFIDEDDNLEEVLLDRTKEKTIIPDLAKYNISEDVAALADVYYKKESNKVFRQKNRVFLLYYYTLMASREIYNDVDPFMIAKHFNLKQGRAIKAVNNFNKKRNVSMLSYTNPLALLEGYCSRLGITNEEDIEEIMNLAKSIILKKPTILNIYAQTLAASIIYYHCMVCNEKIDAERLESITTMSMTTIKKAANDVGLIDNL